MHTAFYLTLGIVFIGLVGPILYRYWKYRTSAERVWYSHLRVRIGRLLDRRSVLKRGPGYPEDQLRQLRGSLLDDVFHRTDISILVHPQYKCSGIGPSTVDTLRSVGISTLLDAIGRDFSYIPGIKWTRNRVIQLAVNKIEGILIADFESGASLQGRQYLRHVHNADAECNYKCQQYTGELSRVEAALSECRLRERACDQLTFLNYFFSRPHGIPQKMVEQSLPDPDHFLPGLYVPAELERPQD